jgi:chitin synthase
MLTTKRVVYVYWLLVYLTALPIWNFILPVYAFWHFDDFSWGDTRKVEGEKKGESHGGDDGHALAADAIQLKRWDEWEMDRRRELILNA